MRRTAAISWVPAALILAACGSVSSSPVLLTSPSPVSLPSSYAAAHHHHGLTSSQAAARNPGVCNPSLWRAVYHPYRLHVVAACKTVTGTVDRVRSEPGGDVLLLVKLPLSRSGLLNDGNVSDTHDDLVAEIICAATVTRADAEPTCAGHVNKIAVPSAGKRVRISGTYVLDTTHGWMEIEPVSRLSVLSAAAPPPAPGTWCSATASYNSSFGDYDVYVHSNQPNKSVTASGGGYSHSRHTDSSGYADVYLRGPRPGQQITVIVGGAACSTTAG
jgi:hypothetical protein